MDNQMKKLNATDGGGEFDESEHPRNEDGEFTKKGNGALTSKTVNGTISRQEYAILRKEILAKNTYRKNGKKPIDCAYTAESFYVYNNKGGENFDITFHCKIEGNEERIAKVERWCKWNSQNKKKDY